MKTRKIFYTPGVFSLLIVPLLFFWYLDSVTPKPVFAIKIFVPTDNPQYRSELLDFSGQGLMHSIRFFKKTELILKSNTANILEQKFDFIVHKIQRLSFTDIKNEALIVRLGPENTLNDFIRLADIANYTALKHCFLGRCVVFFE